jgi:hypothetical protein
VSVEIRDITVKATVAGGPPIDTCTVNIPLNMPPSCVVHFHKREDAENQAADVATTEIAQEIGRLQTSIFSPRVREDASVQMTDGKGGALQFDGFTSSPEYSLSSRDTSRSITILHKVAMLSGYRPNIYKDVPLIGTSLSDDKFIAGKRVAGVTDVSDIATLLLNVNRAMFEQSNDVFLKSGDAGYYAGSKLGKKAYEEQDRVNRIILDQVWLPILRASKNTTKWKEFSNLEPLDKISAGRHCLGTYLLQGEDFFGTLRQFNEAFKMFLTPVFDSRVAILELENEYITKKAGSYKAEIIAVRFAGGNYNALPVTNVLVQGGEQTPGNGFSYASAFTNPGLAIFPTTSTPGGSIIADTGPPWLSEALTNLEQDLLAYVPPIEDTKAVPSNYLSITKNLNKLYDKTILPNRQKLLEDWARKAYVRHSLMKATATLRVPLDLKAIPGNRIEVRNIRDEFLFTGFLNNVSHEMSGLSNNPRAYTTLSFTHVVCPGFQLPFK